MNIGDRVQVDIGSIAHGGHCVARHDGEVIFVRHAVPGEKVIVEITEKNSKIYRGNAIEIVEKSPHRREPVCQYAHSNGCGGCDFQHIAIDYQRELKKQIVNEQFYRIAKKDISCTMIDTAPHDGLHWRTRMEFTVSENRKLALYKSRSHDLVEISECAIADQRMNISEINNRTLPSGSKIDVAVSRSGKQYVAIENRENFDLVDEGIDMAMTVSPRTFWQSHVNAPRALTQAVLEDSSITSGDHVFDLYGGAGLFTSVIAPIVGPTGRVTLIELDKNAITDARRNFAQLQQVEVIENSVERALKKFVRADVVVLDPPRKGAGRDVVVAMTQLSPRTISYVSCDPASLARDSVYLEECGYQLAGVRAFDLFPMTQHVECVARFIPA